jgi:hypothetical protein
MIKERKEQDVKRRLLGGAVGAMAMAAAVLAPPAHAASYTIYGSSPIGGASATAAFQQQHCDPNLAKPVTAGGLTGTDIAIIEISSRANQDVVANWSATVIDPTQQLTGNLQAIFIDGNCNKIPTAGSVISFRPGNWGFHVPAGTKWLVVSAAYVAVTTVSI